MAKPTPKKQNIIEKITAVIDRFQRRHRYAGFPYAVVKKYGDDEMGYQAALVTYYGFLSLFPLLIVATSVIDLVSRNNAGLRDRLTDSINHYFPAVSNSLQNNVHSPKTTGIVLVVSLLFALYGAKGSADAVRHALDHAWEVPRADRPGFPKNTLKSIALIVGGGGGLVLSAFLTSFATAAVGKSFWFKAVPFILSLGLTYLVFMLVFKIGSARKHSRADIRLGAITATIALFILQTAGGYLITHQLQHATGTYGQFGLVLAILFWIYLQAQVVMYAVQINVVHTYKLWPRSLSGKDLTEQDALALKKYAARERMQKADTESVDVSVE